MYRYSPGNEAPTISMPHSDNNTDSSAPDTPNRSAEPTVSTLAGNGPSRGCDDVAGNSGAPTTNSSIYLSDHM
jgi:hypothetical protein